MSRKTGIPKNQRADNKIRQSLKPVPTDSGLVRYHKDTRTFTAWASELSHACHHFNSMVILVNPKTGREVQFDLASIKRDRDGDVQTWEFVSVDIVPPVLLTIFND